MMTTTTASPTLEVATLDVQRLSLSEVIPHLTNPRIHFTRESIENLYQIYLWLAQVGDEYIEQAETVREMYLFCQNILDIEAGIKQGYLEVKECL